MKRKGNASLLLWRRWSLPESVNMFTKAQKKADVVWLICILCALTELVNISGKIHFKHGSWAFEYILLAQTRVADLVCVVIWV